MKPQKLGSNKEPKFIINHISRIMLMTLGMVLIFCACEGDFDKIKSFSESPDMPTQSGINVSRTFSDSGKVQLRLEAPELHVYTHFDPPYYEFPQGIKVFSFDKEEKLESTIVSGWAKFLVNDELWEARDSVCARNVQTGETLLTEHMFWDQKKQKIYSEVFTKITNEDGVFLGEGGFESNQDLSQYKLKGSSGTVRVKDEKQ